MAVTFNEIPTALRAPAVLAEFNSNLAQQGSPALPYRILVLGQKLVGGAWGANTIQRATSVEEVNAGAGRGSMLARMAAAVFKNNTFTEVRFGVLADNGAGVAASGTITVTGPATETGTIELYVGGVKVFVAVNSADTASTIATAIEDAINANGDLPVTATVDSSEPTVVEVTFRHKGEVGNGYDLRDSFFDGESLPAGVTLAYGAMANGTTNPVLDTLIAALGDVWYHVIISPYIDATSLSALNDEMADRVGPMRMIDGLVFASNVGTFSTLATFGESKNSQFLSVVAQPGKSPLTPAFEFASAVGAVAAFYASGDPALPFQTLTLKGVIAPAETDRFTYAERNMLLYDGIGTTKSDDGGNVTLDRLITTYQTAASGAPDESYLRVETVLSLLYLRFSWRTQMANTFPRNKLAKDGGLYTGGQNIVTPKIGAGKSLDIYADWERRGLVQDFDGFKRDQVVEIDPDNPDRLNFKLPIRMIDQFIIAAAAIQFQL